jgi:uncharacterized membrane-anchored protein YhcB (DUF1043 family)
MAQPKLVIQQQKPPIWFMLWGLVVVAALALCFYIGRYISVGEREEAVQRSKELQTQLDTYQEAYNKANQELVTQPQHAKVDSLSNKQLIETIKQLQEKQAKLSQELAFYRGIMAPELAQKGLSIAEFDIRKGKKERVFWFKLVLTQASRQEQFLKGSTRLIVKGKSAKTGKFVSHNFNDLGSFDEKHFKFTFRYFQNIEGEVRLPKGFVAEKVSIVAKTKGLRKEQVAERDFDWKV